MVDIYFQSGNPITGSEIRIVEPSGAETHIAISGGKCSLGPTKENKSFPLEQPLGQGETLNFTLAESETLNVYRIPGRTLKFTGVDSDGKNKFTPLPTSPKRSTLVDDVTLQPPTVGRLEEGLHTLRYRGQELLKINVRG